MVISPNFRCTVFSNFIKRSFDSFYWTIALTLFLLCQNTLFAAGTVGNGNPLSCTDAALNSALVGGGSVAFNCGALPITIVIGNEKTVAADTVIEGNHLITLSGNNSTRLFFVKPGISLMLNNMTLANGFTTGQGGAIHSASFQNTVLNINRCSFIHNVANQPGGAGGGAIFSAAGTVNVSNSTFTDNYGGMGGALRILNSNLNVSGSTFSGNHALDSTQGYGGAIAIDGAKGDNGKITIRRSTFKNNAAGSFGGAIFNNLYNNNSTAVTDSVFSMNSVGGSSKGQGGALWSNGDANLGGHWIVNVNTTSLSIVNSSFSANTSGQQGGAVWLGRHIVGSVISRSTFSGNTAFNSMGGGIVQGDNGKLSIINSTLSGNKGKGLHSMGAGIYVGASAKATLTNTTIADNIANWQAGGIFGGANVTLKNTILANNIALNGGNNWNIKHNCFQTMTDGGNNLQFPSPIDSPCTVSITIADPKLGLLANNGGLTQTRALLPGSAAIRNASGCPATDQRGKTRPNPTGSNCDIGAFEADF